MVVESTLKVGVVRGHSVTPDLGSPARGRLLYGKKGTVHKKWGSKPSHCLLGRGGFMDGEEVSKVTQTLRCHWWAYNKLQQWDDE